MRKGPWQWKIIINVTRKPISDSTLCYEHHSRTLSIRCSRRNVRATSRSQSPQGLSFPSIFPRPHWLHMGLVRLDLSDILQQEQFIY